MRVRYSFSSRHTRTLKAGNAHRQEFPKVVRDLVDRCEIILEVIDSRFIEETRNHELERLVQAKGKKIIYVLNKSDLVDINKLKKEIEQNNLFPFVFLSCTSRRGSKDLRERIKIEVSRLKSRHAKVNIGVVGYPNTGKSSLINMLIGRACARTAPEAGFTKGIQKLKLASDIFIIDTPGVIPDKKYSMQNPTKMAQHAKINVRSWDKVKEPEFAVHELMKQHSGIFEKYYNIEASGDSELLITELGKKKKFLLRGNLVDTDRTARVILKDWQEGRVRLADRKDDEENQT